MTDLSIRITAIQPETHDTATFFFEPIHHQPLSWEAGQFITLVLTPHGKEVRRSYSISAAPGLDPRPSFTVKRKINGEISRHLLDHIHVGNTLHALRPAGRFTLTPQTTAPRDLCFITAGSGIAPVLPLLKKALHDEPQSHVLLINQNHSEHDIIFRSTLDELHTQFSDRFTLINFLSTPEHHNIMPRRLTNATLEQLMLQHIRFNHSNVLFYCCGPLSFMRMTQFTLRLMHYAEEQIKKENFTIDYIPPTPLMTDTSTHTITIRQHGQTHQFPTAYPKSILQSALDHHLHLPYSCRGGRCSTCVARCTSGTLIMSINDVLTTKDLAEGLVLTCVGYATTDITLEYR